MSANLLPPMKWNAWGDPDEAKPLSEGIRSLLAQALGVTGSPEAELEADQVQLRPSALTTADREALAAIVGPDHCCVDDQDRLLRAGGKSTLDLLRRKDFGPQDAPDAVLLPAWHRRRPVRWGHQRGRRPRSDPRRVRSSGVVGSATLRPAAGVRRGLRRG